MFLTNIILILTFFLKIMFQVQLHIYVSVIKKMIT